MSIESGALTEVVSSSSWQSFKLGKRSLMDKKRKKLVCKTLGSIPTFTDIVNCDCYMFFFATGFKSLGSNPTSFPILNL